ncbi:TonB-dependent receptor [Ferrimonas sp. YFM]|uniref:TonB-dependent receptor n=1 Tax=Ferrimonas sp. YFM TaxID=3028878 RepID=UPI002573C8B4|nr:TonB-dependent receptor [Ferrimonas sp. YFM]BDY05871.1 TonB-dependent receptor [Ferrimonas sp. YFM]
MMMQSMVSRAVKGAMLGTLASATLISNVAYAEEGADVERIEVTGSRIVREGAIAPTPVTVITGEELMSTGVTNIGEALNQLPALGNTYSLANSGRFIGTAGLNLLDLRKMGTGRTLVLVDGKRHVAASAGSAAVDVNTIPSVWVEKVEVITGGASAIYGADAVTGVVNFILKKDIEGFEASATKGWADDSGFNKDRFSLSYGTDYAGGRGNAAFAVEYSAQNRLRALDRDQTAVSYSSIKNPETAPEGMEDSTAYPDEILYPNAGYYAIDNTGTFLLDGQWYGFNNDGSVFTKGTGEVDDGFRCAGEGCDFYNLGKYTDLQPEFERYNVNFKTNFELSEDATLYFDAKYVNSQSTDYGQPAFFFKNLYSSAATTPLTISRDNAFVSDSLGALMDEKGVSSLRMNAMLDGLGQRIEDDTRETYRYVLGLNGIIAEDWDYDVYAVYGRTDLERVNKNNMIRANFANALDSIKDENGNAVCRDAEARANGCVPVNVFGEGNVSQEARDYINTVSTGTAKIQQTVFGATFTNSYLFDLPAGSVGLSTGVEYRKEESETHEPDNAEGTFFNSLGEDKGSFNVKEIFAEITIPLLADLPAIQQLDVDAAVRYANYSSTGDATTWKAGLSWSVYDDLRFRSTIAKAIRAPNISELYGAPSETFYSIDDACKSSELDDLDQSAPETAIRRANCAALGIPTDFDSGYDSASVKGQNGGNKDLDPEESTSYTLGAVFQPSFVDGLVVTVDYWSIEIDDAISGLDSQDIVNRCVDSAGGIDNQYCALITRDASTNEITLIKNYSLNIAKLEASGIDFDIGYNFELFGGDLSTNIVATKLLERKDYSFQDEPDSYEDFAGTVGYAEWQANLTMNYRLEAWNGYWRTRYIEDVSLYTDKELARNPNPSNVMSYPSYFITDIAVGYEFENGLAVKLGVDNVFDRDLPYGSTGTGSGSASYDNVGRFVYTTIDYKF